MGNTSSTLKTLVKNFGKVVMLKDGIATVVGLHSVKSGEIVYILKNSKSIFSNKKKDKFVKGLVLNLNIEDINVIILGNERLVSEGNLVYRSEKLLKIDAGLKLFGRVSDAVGNLKDKLNKDFLFDNFIEKFILVEKKATGIVDREPVNKPLRTGIKSVDSLVPIGRGQRELIIGDRQTGKTSIAIDIILNHVLLNNSFLLKDVGLNVNKLRDIVWFVYAAIGQKQSTVSEIYSKLKQKNGLWYTSM